MERPADIAIPDFSHRMLLVAGVLVTPVGALVCTLTLIARDLLIGNGLSLQLIVGVVPYGIIAGSFLAAPATIVVLPIVYAVLRQRGTLNRRRIVIAGAVAVVAAKFLPGLLHAAGRGGVSIEMFTSDASGTLIAAVDGAVSGGLYARIMRRLEPRVWPAPNTNRHT